MPTQPNVKRQTSIQVKLKASDADVQAYVKHLESENRKLHTKFIKFESQHLTDKNRIAALEKEVRKGHVRVTIKNFSD